MQRSEAVVKEKPDQIEKSRSQIKREFLELKTLGIQLSALSKGQIKGIPMSEATRDALLAAKTMTKTALQRQYGHLISLLLEEDVEALRAGLAGKLKPHADEVAAIHEAEQWRDKLLSDDGSQVAALLERYPDCDRTHLRQLVRNTRKETELGKPPKSARQLFKYLRELGRQSD